MIAVGWILLILLVLFGSALFVDDHGAEDRVGNALVTYIGVARKFPDLASALDLVDGDAQRVAVNKINPMVVR